MSDLEFAGSTRKRVASPSDDLIPIDHSIADLYRSLAKRKRALSHNENGFVVLMSPLGLQMLLRVRPKP